MIIRNKKLLKIVGIPRCYSHGITASCVTEKRRERPSARNRKRERQTKMKIRLVKVKKGQMKLHEAIKNALAKKGARAGILIDKLTANKKAVVWIPAELDAIAEELRYLAFQIRNLKNAKKATEEA